MFVVAHAAMIALYGGVSDSPPVYATAETVGTTTTISVRTSDGAAFGGRYALEVAGPNRNVSRMSGVARADGTARVIAVTSVSAAGSEPWQAVLRVLGDDGSSYEQRVTNQR
jgi:hypothetical protein